MIVPGLVSVTFRQKSPEEIISMCVEAKISAIEWGADYHAPVTQIETAKRVGNATLEAGLQIASYGSYYRAGINNDYTFQDVVSTAQALGAPNIRIWAGNKGTSKTTTEEWDAIIEDSRLAANLAGQAGMTLSFEYHSDTLTDNPEDALKLLNGVKADNVYTYWQPPNNCSFEHRLETLQKVCKSTSNVHVFNWNGPDNFHTPLEHAKQEWAEYFKLLSKEEKDRYALIEFVPGGTEQAFFCDAATLKSLLVP